MSKLDELIKELCPDGVEYKRLGEIASYSSTRISSESITAETYVGVDNLLPDKQGKKDSNYVPLEGNVISFDKGDILIGNIRPYLKKIWLSDCSGGTNGDVLVFQIRNKENILSKFLYYLLSSDKFFLYDMQHSKGAKMPRGNKKEIMQYSIPLPPMEVQSEIVKILDNFTELTAELTDKLSEELTARKKQYEYYRNRLLTFENNCRKGKIIDMLARPITDGPHTTPEFTEKGIPFISAESVWDGKIHFEKKRGYITEAFDVECCKKYKPQKNDVFMVKSGSTTGKVAYVDTDERFNIWSPLAAMRVNQENNPRFLFYLLQSEPIQKMVHAKASHGSQPNLSMRALEQFDVMIPPLDVQNRIVKVLDNFDKVCNDLHIGLPAEIEARKKQYEFYRDSLLTFLEKGESILTDRQTDRQTELKYALIKLFQYVFGYIQVRLSDIAMYRSQQMDSSQVNADTYVGVDNLLPNRAGKKESDFVPSAGVLKGYCAGDILIGNIRPYLKKIWYADNDGGTNGDVLVITRNDTSVVNAKYLYYVLSSDSFFLYDMQHSKGAKMPRGDKKAIMEYEFALPKKDIQEKVVDILNRFDTLCHDISSGLPAEIEARQKQYEYYRDKLLDFKEKKG